MLLMFQVPLAKSQPFLSATEAPDGTPAEMPHFCEGITFRMSFSS
jgi:hypothetical protein